MNPPALNPLRPDHEGHYSRLAHEVDRRARAQFAPGKHPIDAIARSMAEQETRRRFFARGAQGIGALALGSMLGSSAQAAALPGLPHFAPRAKRCIYLHLV